MRYIIILVLVFFLLLFVLVYPFRVSIYNQDNFLIVNISKLLNLKINLIELFKKPVDINKAPVGMKVLTKIKLKEVDLKLQGLNFNYSLNGGYFGGIYAFLGFVDLICMQNDIKFNYDLRYMGDKSLEFKSIIKARLLNVIKVFNKI